MEKKEETSVFLYPGDHTKPKTEEEKEKESRIAWAYSRCNPRNKTSMRRHEELCGFTHHTSDCDHNY